MNNTLTKKKKMYRKKSKKQSFLFVFCTGKNRRNTWLWLLIITSFFICIEQNTHQNIYWEWCSVFCLFKFFVLGKVREIINHSRVFSEQHTPTYLSVKTKRNIDERDRQRDMKLQETKELKWANLMCMIHDQCASWSFFQSIVRPQQSIVEIARKVWELQRKNFNGKSMMFESFCSSCLSLQDFCPSGKSGVWGSAPEAKAQISFEG